MIASIKFKWKWVLPVIILVGLIWPSANINWSDKHFDSILESDAKGYYAYLPAAFIYKDLNFGFFEAIESGENYNPNTYYDYRAYHNNKTLNKYFIGTSVLEAPFFFATHTYVLTSIKYQANGYSKPYLISVNVAAIFYCFLGVLFFVQSCKRFDVSSVVAWLVGGVMVFSTNLFYYTVCEPGMSHVFSFFLVSLTLYLSTVLHKRLSFYLPLLGVLAGLIILVRPVNGLVLLVLPLFVNPVVYKRLSVRHVLLAALLFFMVASIQPLVWKIQTGSFLVYAYGEEQLNLFKPHFFDFLFSYKKGLLLYTPVLILLIPSLVFGKSIPILKRVLIALYLLLVVYVLSSWVIWWYGGSYSQRPMIEYYPIIFLPIAAFLYRIKGMQKVVVTFFLLITLSLSVVQTYQYRYEIIHWEDMTKELYWDRFMVLP